MKNDSMKQSSFSFVSKKQSRRSSICTRYSAKGRCRRLATYCVTRSNLQSIPLETKRDDWVPENDLIGDGRFVPASVIWALQRRHKQDAARAMRRVLGGWRDLIILNDEAHHVYGEKKTKKGEEAEYL